MLASVPSAPLAKRIVAVATSSIPSWPWKLADVRADPVDRRPTRNAEHVDVVDAVLEQRAGAGERAVAAPRRAVVALDRDELVVAEHHAHHPAGGRLVDEVLGPQVRRRTTQHQADLVDDTGVGDTLGHLLGRGRASKASGFSQKIARPRAAALSTWRGCSLVHVQM